MPGTPLASANDIVDRLRTAEELLEGIELSTVDASDLPAITGVLRRIEGRCAAAVVAVAARANATGADPSATLLGRGRVSGRRARQEAKRADVVERMPELGRALQSGQVSGEHLDAVARARTGLSGTEAELFDQLSPELADAATKLPVDTFNRRLHTLVDEARSDHGMTRLQQQRARSSLKMWTDPDGMGHLQVTADPERFAHIQMAIEAQTTSLAAAAKQDGGSVTLGPALQLDALVELLGSAGGSAGRPSVTVLVDQATLTEGPHERTVCETDSGVQLPAPVVGRYLCDAVVRHVTLDDAGLPINVGRSYRTATVAQWAALKALYANCAWHGCDRPITWTQAHHIHEWEHGGRTDLDNLIPLCSRHHHMVHDDGWRLVLRPDRTLEIHHPPPATGTGPPHDSGHHCDESQHHAHRHDRSTPPERPGPETLWATTTPDRTQLERGEPDRTQPVLPQPNRRTADRTQPTRGRPDRTPLDTIT